MYDCGHVLLGLRFCIDKMCMKIAPTGSHKEALIVAHTKSVVMVDPVILAVAVEMVTRISQVLFAKKTPTQFIVVHCKPRQLLLPL